MRRILILALFIAIAALGCATPAERVEFKQDKVATPTPAQGDMAVFGKVRLMEKVLVRMPVEKNDASVYLRNKDTKVTYKISCSNAGEFGVYLPVGSYIVRGVKVGGYTFKPESLSLDLPLGHVAVYTGAIVFDGTPTGVDPDTGDTRFIYSVKDEYKDFVSGVRKARPDADTLISKMIFKPVGAIALGGYPKNVFRAKDIENDLDARSKAIEEAADGGFISLLYFINPLTLLSIP